WRRLSRYASDVRVVTRYHSCVGNLRTQDRLRLRAFRNFPAEVVLEATVRNDVYTVDHPSHVGVGLAVRAEKRGGIDAFVLLGAGADRHLERGRSHACRQKLVDVARAVWKQLRHREDVAARLGHREHAETARKGATRI